MHEMWQYRNVPKHLKGKYKTLGYISEYNDLVKEDIEQHICTSRVIEDNHERLVAHTTRWAGLSKPWFAKTGVKKKNNLIKFA